MQRVSRLTSRIVEVSVNAPISYWRGTSGATELIATYFISCRWSRHQRFWGRNSVAPGIKTVGGAFRHGDWMFCAVLAEGARFSPRHPGCKFCQDDRDQCLGYTTVKSVLEETTKTRTMADFHVPKRMKAALLTEARHPSMADIAITYCTVRRFTWAEKADKTLHWILVWENIWTGRERCPRNSRS